MKKCSSCSREFPDTTIFCPYDGHKLDVAVSGDRFIGVVLDGKYLIESKIGQGGMGNVYKAKHVHMETPLAVKILHPHLVSDQTTVERFRREARSAATINHANAIRVSDFGVTEDKTVYLIMEFLEGVSLRKALDTQRPFPIERAIRLIKQTCAAVDAAHASNIVHRDLKPDNIFILKHGTPAETVKVLDFSIAKLYSQSDTPVNLTQQGMVVGTPQYMSPEQAEGLELDSRADIYSLGVILYEMLTGELPFKASTPMALILKHIHALPRPLRELREDVAPAVESVVLRALAKKRENRPQTAQALADELDEAVRQASFSAPEPQRFAEPIGVAAKPQQAVASGGSSAASVPPPPKPPPPPKSGPLPQRRGGASIPPSSPAKTSAPFSAPSAPPAVSRERSLSPERSASPQQPIQIVRHQEEKADNKALKYIVALLAVAIVAMGAVYVYRMQRKQATPETSAPALDKAAWLKKMNMIEIAGSKFRMGRPVGDSDVAADESPVIEAETRNFMLSKYETTNRQYKEFIRIAGRKPPKSWNGEDYLSGADDVAVTGVSWDDANAYCRWLSEVSGVSFRLPTETEWEFAARGADERIYPWGSDWDPKKTVWKENGNQIAVDVTSQLIEADAGPFGIIGMSGNVSEWTGTPFSIYPGSKAAASKCDNCMIIRGGNYRSTSPTKNMTTTCRVWQPSVFADERLGFRIAADPLAK